MSILRPLLLAAALAACSPAVTPGAGDITVSTPTENARIESPYQITGVAPNNWYFEAVFPARLETTSGELIAEAPAAALTDWQVEGPIPFTAEISFDVAAETPAVLVLQEDMPPEEGPTREVRIPVTLLPPVAQ